MSDSENTVNNDINAELQQAVALFQRGELEQAQHVVSRLLELAPDHAGATQLLGGIKTYLGDYPAAVNLFTTATRLNPEHAGHFNNLAYVFHLMGRLEQAQQACLRAVQLKPDFAEAFNTLAVILKDMGQLEQALGAIQRAVQLRPDFIEAHNTQATILVDMKRFDEALAVCRRALQQRPDYAEVHNLLVIVLLRLSRFDEATTASDRAVQLRPDYAPLYDTRGNLLSETGRMQDALLAYNRAIAINPELAGSYYNRGNVLGNLGRFDEAEADYRKAMALNPMHADAHSNLLFVLAAAARLPYQEMLEQQKLWDKIHGEQGRLNLLQQRPLPNKQAQQIRVGYVSADFCKHPVSYFFEPLLAGHDRNRFEIFCYANIAETRADKMTRRLRDLADHWQFVEDKSDFELAALIQQDGIDILVDLAGHSRGNRLRAFTYRSAPVQIMYLGYCASSGLQAMDYWVTDETLHPADTQELSTETIVRLPRCSFCYRPPDEANITPSRMNAEAGVIFASYSHFSKLLPPVIKTWSEILLAVPGSWLKIMDKYLDDEATRKILIDQFAINGISEDRLIISGHLSFSDYYRSYSGVDVVLDPFPRTGGTTTADALWMGVPVITLAGDRYVERISASKLHAVGLDELAASDTAQYVEIAVRLAADNVFRQDLRETLRARMMRSQLCDGRGLAAAMEQAYTEMCNGFYE